MGCSCHNGNICRQKIQQDSGSIAVLKLNDLLSNTKSSYLYICQLPNGQVWIYEMSESNKIIAKYILFGNGDKIYLEEPITGYLTK
jgi:uncharacterized protein with PhoU and TrkA domain